MIDVIGQLMLILLCMLGAAFFAGIETGVISMNRLRLRHLVRYRVPGAATLEYFLQDPDHLLGTTLVGTNLCHVAASVLAADLGVRLLGPPGSWIAAVITVIVVLIFCEYIPKIWFQSSPTLRVLPFAGLLKLSGQALLPVSWTLGVFMKLAVRRKRDEAEGVQPMITRDELMHLAKEGEKSGILSQQERRMIHSVFELRANTCGKIMVPRKDVVFVDTNTSREGLIEMARTKVFSRFPVYDEAKKAFVGIVHIFDVLCDQNPDAKTVADYMRPPQFVSQMDLADHVLSRMRVTRQPLVMVLDERYELVGIVTIEDVLEEIVNGS